LSSRTRFAGKGSAVRKKVQKKQIPHPVSKTERVRNDTFFEFFRSRKIRMGYAGSEADNRAEGHPQIVVRTVIEIDLVADVESQAMFLDPALRGSQRCESTRP
jgi:hypothetical protein